MAAGEKYTEKTREELSFLQKENRKHGIILGGSILLVILLFFASFYVGRFAISSEDTIKILFSKIFPGIERTWPIAVEKIILKARLPRILAAIIVGASLSLSGACYQGVFKNPLVSSDILGASSGAALGAAMSIYLGFSVIAIQLFAFLFSFGSVILAYFIGNKIKRDRTLSLILSGMFVGSLCTALVSLLKFIADPNDKLPVITFWLMGSLSTIQMKEIPKIIIPLIIGAAPMVYYRWKINALSLGDHEALTLGINVSKMRMILVFCATLMTSSSVAAAGLIGWVGLVVPNLARLLVGSDNRILLPASATMGAIFLLVVDDIARSISSLEVPIGVLTAIVGAPFFLSLMIRREES